MNGNLVQGFFFSPKFDSFRQTDVANRKFEVVKAKNDGKPNKNIEAQRGKEETSMAFFNSAVTVLQTLVIALGAGLGIWGAINLLEGYGNDNPGAKSQGMKQLMAGGGVALIGTTLVPLLSGLFG